MLRYNFLPCIWLNYFGSAYPWEESRGDAGLLWMLYFYMHEGWLMLKRRRTGWERREEDDGEGACIVSLCRHSWILCREMSPWLNWPSQSVLLLLTYSKGASAAAALVTISSLYFHSVCCCYFSRSGTVGWSGCGHFDGTLYYFLQSCALGPPRHTIWMSGIQSI